jgi:hypothetical protein
VISHALLLTIPFFGFGVIVLGPIAGPTNLLMQFRFALSLAPRL